MRPVLTPTEVLNASNVPTQMCWLRSKERCSWSAAFLTIMRPAITASKRPVLHELSDLLRAVPTASLPTVPELWVRRTHWSAEGIAPEKNQALGRNVPLKRRLCLKEIRRRALHSMRQGRRPRASRTRTGTVVKPGLVRSLRGPQMVDQFAELLNLEEDVLDAGRLVDRYFQVPEPVIEVPKFIIEDVTMRTSLPLKNRIH